MHFMKNHGKKRILAVCLLICFGFGWKILADTAKQGQPEKSTTDGTGIEEGRIEESRADGSTKEENSTDGARIEENRADRNPIEENRTEEEKPDGEGVYEDGAARFVQEAQKQGVGQAEAASWWERLQADDVFAGGTMELTGLVAEDMDGNGMTDLLVMTLDREEKPFYGSGCVWIYMNADRPYCFAQEDCSYYGDFESFAGDIDNDGNVEIVLSMQGTGCGAVGDSYKVILKYRDDGQGGHVIQTMELPDDLPEEYDAGLEVIVVQETEKNRYSAYCPYLGETVSFSAQNMAQPGTDARAVGGNVRGFFHLRQVQYEGKNALQVSEYLSGEGGIAHGIATAQFIILWDQNGEGYVAEWWIEAEPLSV